MTRDLFDRMRVIDVDTHLTEPPDLWTARFPAARHDEVPHIERIDGRDTWVAGGTRLGAPGFYSMAGHHGVMPASIPETHEDIPEATYDATARLETFDWRWSNGGIRDEHPEYDLLPSEYFRRQIYGCFWFEDEVARDAIDQYPDNILFETDYPHPTCQYPGPCTRAQRPREYAERVLAGVPAETAEKVLSGTAARLYRL